MHKEKKIRVLLVRHPRDGHDRGFSVVATGLRDAGFEVILVVGLADEIAKVAIEENVNLIGYRLMAGEPEILIPALFHKLKENRCDIPVIVGGVMATQQLKELGVVEVFGPGSSLDLITDFIRGCPEIFREVS